MTKASLALLPALALSLAACESQAEQEADAIEDAVEQQADASAMAAGDAIAALGLTESQLLDADLVGADGVDFGDVEQVRRDAAGAVEALLVEVDDTDPDRYVLVPLAGLTTRPDGDDVDVQTAMTRADIDAMPDAEMTMPAQPAPVPIPAG